MIFINEHGNKFGRVFIGMGQTALKKEREGR